MDVLGSTFFIYCLKCDRINTSGRKGRRKEMKRRLFIILALPIALIFLGVADLMGVCERRHNKH